MTRPPLVRIRATSAPVRISAPNERAAAASAAVTPPMPPRGNPQAPGLAVHAADVVMQHHVGGAADLGPAQVPITPDTDSRPRSASLSK